ncbi:protein max [Condylostylus longicornis]|uniref:protein max n=1 Tax=Condylostylus longicornis TaxID=2530218 RepID=UPI00244DC05F|nr:protein max [Condylostylus longicornis]
MSEDDRDIEVDESEEENDSDSTRIPQRNGNSHSFSQAEKRAHHNALERKRRDHIKDSFTCLREAVPSLQGEKASRAQILKKAAEYIQFMRRKNQSHQQDIDDLKKQNNVLETQIRQLERAKDTFALGEHPPEAIIRQIKSENEETSEDDEQDLGPRSKKIKTPLAYHA